MKAAAGDNLGHALKEVAKSMRLQKRHLAFWVILILFSSGLFYVAKNAGSLFASTLDINENISATSNAYTVNISIAQDGQATVNGKKSYAIFRPEPNFDELKYKVFDKPESFIDRVVVRVHFFTPLPTDTKPISFAVHGIEQATQQIIDEHTIEYQAFGVGPEATYTIAAEIPSGTINWPFWLRSISKVNSLSPIAWLVIGITLPVITLIVLVLMFGHRLRSFVAGEPQLVRAGPPQALPPALAGILVNGRISSREIAATLLDLANRGYLTVFNRGNGEFSFAKRAPWQNLHSFELILLSQMFGNDGYKSSGQDIQVTVGAQLFSPQISKVYIAMYDAATQLGLFYANPATIHRRYRFAGLMLFFLGLLAFIAVLLFEIHPAYLVFFFAGVMTMALVIMFAADTVPLWTKQGEEARLHWLEFRNYLASPVALGYVEGTQDYYEKFLPYAVAMKAEIQWAHRFQNFPFRVPDWYGSTQQNLAIEDFANGLYGIVGSIAQLFASAKEPTIH